MQTFKSDSYRVLHILDHSLPIQSGYSYRTLGIIRAQRERGWTTLQLTTPRHVIHGPNPEEIGEFTFHRTPWEPRRIANSIIRDFDQIRGTGEALARLCREFAPAILHAHSPVLTAFPALRIGRRLDIPVVYEVRAFWEDAAVSEKKYSYRGPRYLATRWLETRAMRQAGAIVTICRGLRDEIVSRGIPFEKVAIVPNAVDIERLPPIDWRDSELAQRLNLDKGPVLGFIGSFYKYEGLSLLVEALVTLRQSLPTASLLLVGGGPEESSLRQRVQSMGLGSAVIMPGRIPHSDVQRYYSLIDICVYPRLKSRLTDLVTPLKPLESMSQKRLVLASDVGGHRELVRHGETGYLFPSGNPGALAAAVLQLMENSENWPLALERARRYVETERTWARVTSEYREVYSSLVNKPRSPVGTGTDAYATR